MKEEIEAIINDHFNDSSLIGDEQTTLECLMDILTKDSFGWKNEGSDLDLISESNTGSWIVSKGEMSLKIDQSTHFERSFFFDSVIISGIIIDEKLDELLGESNNLIKSIKEILAKEIYKKEIKRDIARLFPECGSYVFQHRCSNCGSFENGCEQCELDSHARKDFYYSDGVINPTVEYLVNEIPFYELYDEVSFYLRD